MRGSEHENGAASAASETTPTIDEWSAALQSVHRARETVGPCDANTTQTGVAAKDAPLGQPTAPDARLLASGRAGGNECLTDANLGPVCVTERANRPTSRVRDGYGHLRLLRLQHQGDTVLEQEVAALGEELFGLIRGGNGDKDVVLLLRREGVDSAQERSGRTFLSAFGVGSYAVDNSNPLAKGARVVWSTIHECVAGALYVRANESRGDQVVVVPCSENGPLVPVIEVSTQWWERYVAGLDDLFGQQCDGQLMVRLRRSGADSQTGARAEERKERGQHYVPFLTAVAAIGVVVAAGSRHRGWWRRPRWAQALLCLRPPHGHKQIHATEMDAREARR